MKPTVFFIAFALSVVIAGVIFSFKEPSDRQKEMDTIGYTMEGSYPYFPPTGACFFAPPEDDAVLQETRFEIAPRHIEPVKNLEDGLITLVIWRHTINDSALQRHVKRHVVLWEGTDSIFNYYLVKQQ